MNVFAAISSVIAENSERLFLIDALGERRFSYGEFHRHVCHFASLLEEYGVERGDRVVLLLPNSAELAMLYFACLYRQAVAVPVNPASHAREVGVAIASAQPRLVVLSPSTAALQAQCGELRSAYVMPPGETASEGGRTTWTLQDATGELPPVPALAEEDLFAITFTSGTTGLPKGVCHTVGSLFGAAVAFNGAHGFDGDSRFFHTLPMTYMAGFLNTLLCPFLAGGSVVVAPAFNAPLALRYWELAARYEANTLWLVPTIAMTLLQLDRGEVGACLCREKIRTACIGTAPLPAKLKRGFEHRYGIALQESYGLSETLFVASNTTERPFQPGSVGPLLDGVTVVALDEDGAPLPIESEGELSIRAPWHFQGYFDPQTGKPDAASRQPWFRSGDVGYLDAQGYLFITGRKKDLIIRGGVNLSPHSIESVLEEHSAITQSAVVGVPHEFYGEEVVAFVKLAAGASLAACEQDLLMHCKQNLSPASIPSRFLALDEFPLGSTGKIQKDRLRALAHQPAGA